MNSKAMGFVPTDVVFEAGEAVDEARELREDFHEGQSKRNSSVDKTLWQLPEEA